MIRQFATTIFATAAIAAVCTASVANAAAARDNVHAGDKYGYTFRVDMRDVFGALAGMDRSGVSADPARKFDVYTDGALA